MSLEFEAILDASFTDSSTNLSTGKTLLTKATTKNVTVEITIFKFSTGLAKSTTAKNSRDFEDAKTYYIVHISLF